MSDRINSLKSDRINSLMSDRINSLMSDRINTEPCMALITTLVLIIFYYYFYFYFFDEWVILVQHTLLGLNCANDFLYGETLS